MPTAFNIGPFFLEQAFDKIVLDFANQDTTLERGSFAGYVKLAEDGTLQLVGSDTSEVLIDPWLIQLDAFSAAGVICVKLQSDTWCRIQIDAGGTLSFGTGAVDVDATLTRGSFAGAIKFGVDGVLEFVGSDTSFSSLDAFGLTVATFTGGGGLCIGLEADSFCRTLYDTDGSITIGSGAAAFDIEIDRVAAGVLRFATAQNVVSQELLRLESTRATRADNDEIFMSFHMPDSGGTDDEWAVITVYASDITTGADADGVFQIETLAAGAKTLTFRVGHEAAGVLQYGFGSSLASRVTFVINEGVSDLTLDDAETVLNNQQVLRALLVTLQAHGVIL